MIIFEFLPTTKGFARGFKAEKNKYKLEYSIPEKSYTIKTYKTLDELERAYWKCLNKYFF